MSGPFASGQCLIVLDRNLGALREQALVTAWSKSCSGLLQIAWDTLLCWGAVLFPCGGVFTIAFLGCPMAWWLTNQPWRPPHLDPRCLRIGLLSNYLYPTAILYVHEHVPNAKKHTRTKDMV